MKKLMAAVVLVVALAVGFGAGYTLRGLGADAGSEGATLGDVSVRDGDQTLDWLAELGRQSAREMSLSDQPSSEW